MNNSVVAISTGRMDRNATRFVDHQKIVLPMYNLNRFVRYSRFVTMDPVAHDIVVLDNVIQALLFVVYRDQTVFNRIALNAKIISI